jgi:hypothetical protein
LRGGEQKRKGNFELRYLTTANCKSAAIGDRLIALLLPPSPVIVRSMRDWLVLMAHRILLGLGAMLVSPQRILKVAVAIRPATLLRFHRTLARRKYQWLFSAKTRRRPGPKGPPQELIGAILEIKRPNPRFGCRRIAQQISHAFGLEIDKDMVRRIPIPVSSVASESANSRHRGNQVRPLHASLSAVHRAADRCPSARVSRPDLLLEGLDLHRKLDRFSAYYNQRRVHAGLGGKTLFERYATNACQSANLHQFAWRSDCSGLFHTPIAA